MSDFEADKKELLADLDQSRAGLMLAAEELRPEDFGQARRGSWSISRILDHVVHSERLYAQLVSVFSGVATSIEPSDTPSTPAEALGALETTRTALLEGISRVKEEDFYRLQTIGHEEYSVLSILENVANHDREHAEQIQKTIGEGQL